MSVVGTSSEQASLRTLGYRREDQLELCPVVFESAFDTAAQTIRFHFVGIWKDDRHALCWGEYRITEARQFGVVVIGQLLEKVRHRTSHI